jgi:hypothetical protein
MPIALLIAPPLRGQTTASPTGKPIAPGLIKLTGDDEERAKHLNEQIEQAVKADHWDEAGARADELFAIRSRAQGPTHFETVDTEWRLKVIRQLASMSPEDRITYRTADTMAAQAAPLAANLDAQGKYDDARQRWLNAAKSQAAATVRVAFTGLGRVGSQVPIRLALAAVRKFREVTCARGPRSQPILTNTRTSGRRSCWWVIRIEGWVLTSM